MHTCVCKHQIFLAHVFGILGILFVHMFGKHRILCAHMFCKHRILWEYMFGKLIILWAHMFDKLGILWALMFCKSKPTNTSSVSILFLHHVFYINFEHKFFKARTLFKTIFFLTRSHDGSAHTFGYSHRLLEVPQKGVLKKLCFGIFLYQFTQFKNLKCGTNIFVVVNTQIFFLTQRGLGGP